MPMTEGSISIGIVGSGRVAQTLGRLLRELGEPVVAIAGRNPETDSCGRSIHRRTHIALDD